MRRARPHAAPQTSPRLLVAAAWLALSVRLAQQYCNPLPAAVMSNLMSVVPFLGNESSPPASRAGCFAYPDMLEVGRMPEHNVAESRSHFAAWSIVTSPLTLGNDLTDESAMAVIWPIISNREVIEISQTWLANATQPTGRLAKQWRAYNVPTLVAPSCKCLAANRNHECTRRNCSVCSPGNLSDDGVRGGGQDWPGLDNLRGWSYDASKRSVKSLPRSPTGTPCFVLALARTRKA